VQVHDLRVKVVSIYMVVVVVVDTGGGGGGFILNATMEVVVGWWSGVSFYYKRIIRMSFSVYINIMLVGKYPSFWA